MNKPKWSDTVILLNAVIPHSVIAFNILYVQNRKSILSDPRMYNFQFCWSLCRCTKGSYNLYSLHVFAIPPFAFVNASLPSIDDIILCPSFRNFFISFIVSVIITMWGCSCLFDYCIMNHCCFTTVVIPVFSILILYGLYIVMIVVRLLFFPSTVIEVYLPIPDGSSLFCNDWWRKSIDWYRYRSPRFKIWIPYSLCFRRTVSNFFVWSNFLKQIFEHSYNVVSFPMYICLYWSYDIYSEFL